MKITSFKILKMLPLIEKGEKSVPYVKTNLIVILKYIEKFETIIIILAYIGVLQIVYAI